MIIAPSFALAAAALAVEAAVGYPPALFRAIRHPVVWLGALIAALDRGLNRGRHRRAGGVATVLVILLPAAAVMPVQIAARGPAGFMALALLASSLLAQRSLASHVGAVASGLRAGGLEGGRAAVAHIVGRNPLSLDAAGVARAAIESLAENFSDGVVAPAFWLALLGLPGIVAYKAINTADSMIGHRTPRHAEFGWAAARLDDGVNLPASRLAAGLLTTAALLLPWASGRGAWRAVWRDARRHRSPNAGWPEAAMAGALGLRLAGPRVYGTTRVEDSFMGDGRAEVGPADIARALTVYRLACGLQWGIVAIGTLLS